jgi:hypothetical protein
VDQHWEVDMGGSTRIRTKWLAGALGVTISTWGLALAPPEAAAQDFPISASLPAESRQFDFWIGEWDVNLRIRQPDLTWADQIRAVAQIYPILNGKAVLELWSDAREAGIKGYSLRHFDTAREEWVLWLNWPGPNRSGSASLSGTFRHGRGEFFARQATQDGGERISRYTFSDIAQDRLRWDDAFSTDGGESWTHGWIMEFTRRGPKPTLSAQGGPEHTFHSGGRCDAPGFRAYDFLSGRTSGPIEVGGSGTVVITGHEILDGCAVMTFAGTSGDPERAFAFSHITWNTSVSRLELTTLTSGVSTPVRMFYGADGESAEALQSAGELVLYERVAEGARADRFRIARNGDGSVTWAHQTPDGGGWRSVWQARVSPG